MLRPRDRRRGSQVITDDNPRPIIDGFATSANTPPALRPGQNTPPAHLPGKQATAERSRNAVRYNGDMTDIIAGISSIAASGLRDVLSDDEARQNSGYTDGAIEPPTPQNLPAVISTAIAKSDDNQIVPEWHMVKHMPGYMMNSIRALGRMVFSQFTDTAIEDIQTVTTLTNDEAEVKALMAWIKKNGIRDDKTEMDFSATIQNFKADAQLWNVENYSFLLVRDNYGHYVYGWPGGRGVHLEQEPERLRLR